MLNERGQIFFKNHTVWFNLHVVLERASLIYVTEIIIMVDKGGGRLERGTKIWGVMELYYILFWEVVAQTYMSQLIELNT